MIKRTKKTTQPTIMKIGVLAINNFSVGKANIFDKRLDTMKELAHSSKKTYVQVEVITDPLKLKECTGIISTIDRRVDFILADLEFVEKRLGNVKEDSEKSFLNKLKEQLEKERFISELQLSPEEENDISAYALLTARPIFLIQPQEAEDRPKVLFSAYTSFGYISFFTANEKEARGWSLRQGMTCWEASGLIHSDIQKGFIRAEVIGFNDLANDGSISQARTNNHLRLENKDYVVQDGDLIKFRFNK